MEPSDEVLLSACRRGDEAAWDLLVDRYKRLIYTIARRAGLDAEQSSDVLQRVFTILLERLHRDQQPTYLAPWFTATTRHEAWRMRRREALGATGSAEPIEAFESMEDRAELPEELVLRLESQQRVRQALEALDPRCRELLTLLFLRADRPSYTEVADALRMREGAIGPTRARCLEKLRRLLSDDE